jgi:hypothetical protein
MNGFRTVGLVGLMALCAIAPACGGGMLGVSSQGGGLRLAEVDRGVWVVEGASEPIFFADGFYWRYSRNGWYTSRYLDGSFAYAPAPRVPRALRRLEQPRRYEGYRAQRGTTVRAVPREHLRGDYDRYGDQRRYDDPRYDDPRYDERWYESRREVEELRRLEREREAQRREPWQPDYRPR